MKTLHILHYIVQIWNIFQRSAQLVDPTTMQHNRQRTMTVLHSKYVLLSINIGKTRHLRLPYRGHLTARIQWTQRQSHWLEETFKNFGEDMTWSSFIGQRCGKWILDMMCDLKILVHVSRTKFSCGRSVSGDFDIRPIGP